MPTAPGAPAAHTDRGRASTQASVTSNTVLEETQQVNEGGMLTGEGVGDAAVGVTGTEVTVAARLPRGAVGRGIGVIVIGASIIGVGIVSTG